MPRADKKNITFRPSLKEMQKRNRKALKELKNFTASHRAVAVFLDQWVQRNFKSEGGKVGGWKPLADSTVRGRRQGGGQGGAKILQDTGRLRASFVPFANKKDAGIGSDLPYAKTHEKGINVQMRRMLPKEMEVSKDVKRIFDKQVKRGLNKLRRRA